MNTQLERLERLLEDEDDTDAPFPVQGKDATPLWQLVRRWKFTPGKVYELRETVRKTGTVRGKAIRARFLRDVGVNHLFQRRKGWYESWTDNQLVGVDVKELRG